MTLTTAILTANGFALFDDLYTISIPDPPRADIVVSFDLLFHIIFEDNAYPMVTTVEEANDTFERLEIDLTLV